MTHTLIEDGFDVSKAVAELESHPEFWKAITARQDAPESPHVDTETIILRGPTELSFYGFMQSLESVNYGMVAHLPECVNLALEIIKAVKPSEVGRVVIVNLKAGGKVIRHRDEGNYAEHFMRFHLPMKINEHTISYSEADQVVMKAGELWQFPHRLEHWVENNGDSDRWNMIIDIKV